MAFFACVVTTELCDERPDLSVNTFFGVTGPKRFIMDARSGMLVFLIFFCASNVRL